MRSGSLLFMLAFICAILPGFNCPDDRHVLDYDRFGKGAYPRLEASDLQILDLRDSESTYTYTVAFVDACQGCEVAEYRIYATYDDRSPDVNAPWTEVLFATYQPDAFFRHESGHLAVTVDLRLNELAAAAGLALEEIRAGNYFRFRTEVWLKDGQAFTRANSTATVNGNAFKSYFDFSLLLTCPLEEDQFTGAYKIEYVTFEPGPHGPIFGMTPP
ncbi:MAG: hypothetical protein R3301_09740, partial [Saprospiraceae bacterium]|nr:hypothetical protein [Saprospiraceae bacterium]